LSARATGAVATEPAIAVESERHVADRNRYDRDREKREEKLRDDYERACPERRAACHYRWPRGDPFLSIEPGYEGAVRIGLIDPRKKHRALLKNGKKLPVLLQSAAELARSREGLKTRERTGVLP
jgi:hypothetical protein